MRKYLLQAAAALAIGTVAHAAPVISESFDYSGVSDGTNVAGLNGGTGFTDTWKGPSTNFHVYRPTGYDLPALLGEAGGSAQFGTNTNVLYRAFSNSGLLDTWFSLIIDPTSTPTVYGGGRVMFESLNSTNNGYGINYDINIASGSGNPQVVIYPRVKNTNITSSSATVAGRSPFLVVGKWDDDEAGGGSLKLWINPTNLASEASLDSSATHVLNSGAITAVTKQGGVTVKAGTSAAPATSAPILIDELRLGQALDDVTGVPEPASLSLLGLAGLALARRRRQ